MTRAALLLCAAVLLPACTTFSKSADALARDQAKQAVNTVVTNRFPGVNPAPVTDCIIDAASANEILRLAGATVTGVTQATAEEVLEIAQRPDDITCYTRNSIALMGL